MKSKVIFKKISILSLRDKKAFSHVFSPNVNFIYGTNDVGKSSLIKSLYYTLGGDLRLDDLWKADDIITSVEIESDNGSYVFLRYKKLFGVLDTKKDTLHSFSSISALSKYISEIFGFKLQLPSKYTGATVQANPACLYAPFFIDQDEGWKAVINSFESMGMYSDWQKNIIYYHSGVKPKEYYITQGQIKEVKVRLAELESLKKTLNESKKKIDKSFGVVLFDVDLDSYKIKLKRTLDEFSKLNMAQTDCRLKLLKLYSRKNFIESELREIISAVEDDYSSANANTINESLNEYHYINHKDVMFRNIAALNNEKSTIEADIVKLTDSLDEIKLESEGLEGLILDTKSEITLHDLVRSAAYKEIYTTFASQLEHLSEKIDRELKALSDLQDDLKVYDDKKRTARINANFKATFAHALKELGVENSKVGGLISYNASTKGKTGSRGPRGIFAFHYALLSVSKLNSSVVNMPIVIDSPKQQDLDKEHTHKLIKLCLDEFSNTNQIIIGTVDDESFMDGFSKIKLEEKYQLLNVNRFDAVYEEIMPLFERLLLLK